MTRLRLARPGMTLVETLVGLVLLGLVSTLGLASLGLVGRAGAVAVADNTALTAVQDLLRLRLLAAVPVVGEGSGGRPAVLFEGGAERLAFITELPGRFGVSGLALVGLRREAEAVQLRWRPLRGAAEGEGTAGRLLLENVAMLRLRYFGVPRPREAAAWHDAWSEASALPAVVGLAIAFKPGDTRHWPPLLVAPRLAATRMPGA
ncbi:prepilin-type N-terminal cleavage/methylation domain-containing protein [Siccirubricoccus sp. G192]|uniref:prepilin-type N-terminal cleavage/methylation domain-containing protein n=1 Tax=Siccirubricoccus sp. G192 TaxID=2849651 RepID=UPI001C2C42CD|nr:prepilin-type N-terminal cleavage/methylation domain-containing protein [Siccirubricoccus sp. G192]MBV1800141.1 prepilin-type N-terminal cleavage/methylation domain-containing protein [Siccirubricoccus sp. G192]